jgi:ribonuclease HII
MHYIRLRNKLKAKKRELGVKYQSVLLHEQARPQGSKISSKLYTQYKILYTYIMILPHLEKEEYYWNQGLQYVAGIDEAGRGPLAGPVVAGAVIVYPHIVNEIKDAPEFKLVRDSKTLSAKQREKAYDFVVENFDWGVGLSDEKTIDRLNILQATFLAMKKALSDLKRKLESDVETILLDGRSLIPNISTRQENIINGDKYIFSISAASIIAKVSRDRIMMKYHEKFPEYNFAHHKGYGTKEHFEMIGEYGICDVHRISFEPCKNKKSKIQSSNVSPNPRFQ